MLNYNHKRPSNFKVILLNHFKADFIFTGLYEEFRASLLIENETTIQSPRNSLETCFFAFHLAVFKLGICLWIAVQSQQNSSSIFKYELSYQTNIVFKWPFKRRNG